MTLLTIGQPCAAKTQSNGQLVLLSEQRKQYARGNS